jgi:hypothetical protein
MDEVGYDPETLEMQIIFSNGSKYSYPNTTQNVADVMQGESREARRAMFQAIKWGSYTRLE